MTTNHRLNLANLFYDEPSQRYVIGMMADEFRKLVEVQKPYSPCVIYGPPRSEDLKINHDVEVPKTNTDLSGILRNTTPKTNYISLEYIYNYIKEYMLWVNTSNTSYKVRLWNVLLLLYVCPKLRDLVKQNTEPALFIPYFENFEKRFTVSVCGILIHQKERKEDRSHVRVEAKAPIDIVISERMLFDFIRSSRPIDEPHTQ